MTRSSVAAAVLALCLVLLHGLTVSPASAHATLTGSDPKDGAQLSKEPATVSLTFNEDVATPAQLQVTAPDGTELAGGEPNINGGTVKQSLTKSGLAGTYTIAYRVISADGHPISGELRYEVTGGTEVENDAAAEEGEESFVERHGTHLILGGVAVLVAALLLLWPWIRRRV